MVATDVASRGIGMIENPSLSIAMPSRLYRSALLSTLRRFLACVILPGLCRVLRFSIRGILDLWCSISLATLVIPCSKYRQDTGAELAFLDLSSLSPRLPTQRTRMCGSPAPAEDTAVDSPCQMQREYWMHTHAASLARWNIAIHCLFLLTHI